MGVIAVLLCIGLIATYPFVGIALLAVVIICIIAGVQSKNKKAALEAEQKLAKAAERERRDQEWARRQAEQERLEEERLRQKNDKADAAARKKIAGLLDAVQQPKSLSALLQSLESVRAKASEITRSPAWSSETRETYQALREYIGKKDARIVNAYLEKRYAELMENALSYMTLKEFRGQLNAFFRSVDRYYESLPAASQRLVEKMKLDTLTEGEA